MSQLALPLQLADHAVFASYLASGNEALVAELQALANGNASGGCYLWGASATGKTHLLQAVCDQAGDESIYLPMTMFASAPPDILDGFADRRLVCIDDVDTVAGQPEWERALFGLYNQATDVGSYLILAASAPPRAAAFTLADLQSRFSQLSIYQLQALNDAETCKALQLRAGHRGLDLPDDTAQYLISRNRRDMASLYQLLDKLDSAAMQAQRRLTIPFVRQVLADDAS